MLQTENIFKVRIVRTDFQVVRVKGLEPPCRKALDPKSSASTNFATPAVVDPDGLEPSTARL